MSWESTELPPISDYLDHPDKEWFKAKDRAGNVYRVFNPSKLKTYTDSQGRCFVNRPEPVKIEDANSAPRKRSGIIF